MGERMRSTLAIGLVLLTATAVSAQDAPKPAATLTQRIADLEAKTDTMNGWIASLENRTGDRYKILDCATGTFGYMMPSSGTGEILASCQKIEPYLEGYRITLSIGNPYSMQLDKVAGELGYGENFTATFAQKKDFTLLVPLRPGVWTQVIVTINQVSAKDVRTIVLRNLTVGVAQGVTQ